MPSSAIVVLFTILSVPVASSHQIPEHRQCNYYMGEIGWRCDSGDCIPEKYVCDTNQQCYPDESDEEEGCNLFPETPCKSWKGKKYAKCPGSDHCVIADRVDIDCIRLSVSGEEKGQETGEDPTSRVCPDDSHKWRCDDGYCIPSEDVCDEKPRCSDGSDEEAGCRLFPETGCPSYFATKHEKCVDWFNGDSESIVCTLPRFLDGGECRNCTNPNEWRCDSGWCIPRVNVLDGIPDCLDGSDERRFIVRWWWIFVITLTTTGVGMLLVFCFRLVVLKKGMLYCGWCSANRSRRLKHVVRVERDWLELDVETVDSPEAVTDCDGGAAAAATITLPMRLINILDDENNWRKKSLRSFRDEELVKHLYASVHQRPRLYRNLYEYLLLRYDTSKKLAKISDLLFRLEKDFHGEDDVEVVKCWRLHLGCCQLFKRVLTATQRPGYCERLYLKICLPARNHARKFRHKLPPDARARVSFAYRLFRLVLHAVKPFVSLSFFYFEMLKNFAFFYIIHTTLYDMVRGNLADESVRLETTVVCLLVASNVVCYALFCLISFNRVVDFFEMWVCIHFSSRKSILLKVFAVVFAPFVPIFLLANQAYCHEKVHSMARDLTDAKTDRQVVETFKEIQRYKFRSQVHSRSYSMFRTVYAAVGSSCMIVAMVLIFLVSGHPERKVKLMDGVIAKIGDFASIARSRNSAGGGNKSLLEQLNLVRDLIFLGSFLFSGLMVVSALAKHVYHSKGKNMTTGGQMMLSAYFACHSLCRMTMFVVFFSADSKDAAVSLFAATVITAVLFALHLISVYFFKWKFVDGFSSSSMAEQAVHVVVNSLVAVPFKVPDTPRLEDIDEKLLETPGNGSHRKRSLDDVAFATTSRSRSRVARRCASASGFIVSSDSGGRPFAFDFPDIAAPLLVSIGDLGGEIERMWWRNPIEPLRLSSVREKLSLRLRMSVSDVDVERAFNNLVENGFINKRLYNPRRTRLEYFWLLAIHFLFNILSLSLEMANGGIPTSVGGYVSWDVRLSTFFVGLVFLGLYYRRYHLSRNLIAFNVCGQMMCCSKRTEGDPVQAIPSQEELQRCLSVPSQLNEKKTITTQTSITATVACNECEKAEEGHFDQDAVLRTAAVDEGGRNHLLRDDKSIATQT